MSKDTDQQGNFSYSSNITEGPPKSTKSPYQIIYEILPIAVIIIIVNSIVLYLFAKCKRLRTPTNCLLLSLAVCDFMTGFVCIPLFIIVIVKPQILRPHLGRFNVVFNNTMAMSAAYHILAITLERYFCIKRPFVHRQLTKKSMLKVALFVWFVAVVIGFMPYAWYPAVQLTDIIAYKKTQVGYVVFCLTFVFLVPCILIVVSQTVMFKAIAKSGGGALTASKAAQRKAKNDKKCLIIFALMAFIYVVCWLPWFILSLCFSFWFPLSKGTIQELINISQVVVTFRYLTSIVNPLLYTFFKRDFLNAFKLLVLRQRSAGRASTIVAKSTVRCHAKSQQRKLIGRSNSNEDTEPDTCISTTV
ncbi:hypothetical protein OS493_023947 [Desmophyllum pertusum]|uniref:G-protein coupled receptors family 1 profile domain-containing protein n=1 Tax=Desmophyllum pertusum TaxID=174260 RepID=A0A9W9YAE8_9CNID|nr:hypothetical protein OS493_023947 [Desmophyllum pertusum]